MRDPSRLIICEYCDSVYQRPQLATHQKAECQRCGAVIHRHHLLSPEQLLALGVTAALLQGFLWFYPVLQVSAQGEVRSATLPESILALAQGPIALMAVATALAILVVPALQASLLVWLTGHAQFRQRAPGFGWSMRVLAIIRPWNMLEVFLLGALVAVVKLSGRLDAAPAMGLFALGGLSLLMIGTAGRDLHLLWEKLP